MRLRLRDHEGTHTHRLLVAKQALDLLARVDAHLPSQPRQLLKPKAHRTALRYAAPLATYASFPVRREFILKN